ncbi:RNA polymerase sigma factor [Candidatus Parabeggiatoa sp. HSG14]|uniref:RNA polymerase sigma factor n=1 Tax=Candidatus Parabeggiatoa sp. HSG14 TaxID=3055593 RepID=UPI0025A7B2DE|nr:RNA polymerase sigma factor [Thiotrichales bacterium HSG14]
MEKIKMDDKAAFEDIRNGGQSGYTVLYKRYVKSLRYYMIAKHNIPEKSVEDVLQKTFIKFFDSLPNFKQNCSLSTWLYLIANSAASDYWRKNKSDGNTISIHNDETEEGNNLIDVLLEPLLTEKFQKEENDLDIQMCLERALAQLESDGSKNSLLNCLKILTLQAQGASIEEISKKIERTLVATRRYLSDCRTRLKQYQPIQWCRELLNKH